MQVTLLLSLVLLGFSHYGYAEQHHHRVAQQKSRVKDKVKPLTSRKKISTKQRASVAVRNMLHPFTLRLLYTPSYRLLSKHMRDMVEESKDAKQNKVSINIAQFLPISVGLEGEFAFNQWLSLAVGGSFAWQDEFMTYAAHTDVLKEVLEQQEQSSSIKFYEYVVEASLYCNMFDYFKLGAGAELAFRNLDFMGSFTERGKKYEDRGETTWKRVSAHLAVRRDFFLSRVGFGVGFNASLPLSDMLDRQEVDKRYIDGKLQQPKENSNTVDDNDDNGDNDDDEEKGVYSVVLMPMLYVAF